MLCLARFLLVILISTFMLSLNASPIIAQIPNNKTLFYDDFTNSLDLWRIKYGNWYIDQGVLVNKSYNVIDQPSRIEVGEENWKNFRLEVDLNNLDGIDSGIGFRKNNINNSNYELTIRHGKGEHGPGETSTPQIFLQKVYWNQPYVNIKSSKVLGDNRDFPLLHNTWYHIKIEVLRNNIKVWVDNTKLFDITDNINDVKSGFITLATWTGKLGKINVTFDNIRVTSLEPVPFLDLPWDYTSKGLSFNEAALSIGSFFDHQYPLLSRNLDLSEPATASANIVDYLGRTTDNAYTKHDGYDYGNLAKARLGDPVLAAASGSATFVNSCTSCGNMIAIDHGNGYQTRYMHLQDDGLITNTPNQPVSVSNRQQIGKVGFSGNIKPKNERGAHIHFGIFQDINGDGKFDDNEPDGVTDPYGWQGNFADPWENYIFNYLGQNRIGNSSYYLWKNKLTSMTTTVASAGATISTGNYTLTFPQNFISQPLIINTQSTPVVQPANNLVSVGSALLIKATDNSGSPITQLSNPFTVNLNFGSLDVSKINTNTLSFYSSPDGTNWSKENTSFPTPTQAQTQLDHFSYLALIGEREDTTAPTTNAILDGAKGKDSWYKSSVKLILKAKDNEGGLGVDYTAYRINGGADKLYASPLILTDEGHYQIEFYSVDKDNNIEEIKKLDFDIDKTPPEAKIYLDPQTGLQITGLDTNQTSISLVESVLLTRVYKITDSAGNTLRFNIGEFDPTKNDRFRINYLKYNQSTTFLDNRYLLQYDPADFARLAQRFLINNKVKVRIRYDKTNQQSEITTISNGNENKEIKNGMLSLSLITNKGHLEYKY